MCKLKQTIEEIKKGSYIKIYTNETTVLYVSFEEGLFTLTVSPGFVGYDFESTPTFKDILFFLNIIKDNIVKMELIKDEKN